MSTAIELTLAYIILIPFIIINIIFTIGLFFQKITGIFLQKTFKIEEKSNSMYKILTFTNLILWIVIGLINVFNLDNPMSFGALLVFLAFHSGTSLSKRLIFGFHDLRIIKTHSSEKKITKIISRAVGTGILIELMFLLSWAILYRYLNISVKSNFDIEANTIVLILWFSGFIYGFISSSIQSYFSKHFLLKNEIGIIILFSGELLKEKIKRKRFILKSFREQINI